jgi:ketosteroid isomerase-like protein
VPLSVPELAHAYATAWATHDVDAILALHSPDSVFHVHGLMDAATGREAIAGLITTMLTRAPDLRFEARRGYLGTDHIVFEYVMSGTSDDATFACDGVDVIAITDGLVSRKDTYLDLAAYAGTPAPQARA